MPPSIALTASAFEKDRIACVEAGMTGFLSKPFSIDELAATLRLSGCKSNVPGACLPNNG